MYILYLLYPAMNKLLLKQNVSGQALAKQNFPDKA
jgi:hypothetical protein